MKLKSYFASTVEAAMALARQELGPEAMLVNSRRTTPEARQLGEYEVVFALLPADAILPAAAPSGAPAADAPRVEMVGRLADEIHDLKQRIDRLSVQFVRTRVAQDARQLSDAGARLLSALLDAGVEDETASTLAARAALYPSAEQGLLAVLKETIRFDSSLGRPGRSRRVIAVVGPPGSGKTTTLVKLAARYGLTARKPALILSADSVRIAAADQLRCYATILGTGFQCVDTGFALARALEEHRNKDLILLDTPGLSTRDIDLGQDLAEVLTSHPDIDVHLTLPASMRDVDLARIVDRYSIFGPHKVIFTRVDEAVTAGGLINQAVRTNLPVSFVATGQQVPEDLEPASASLFAELLGTTPVREEIGVAARNE